MKRLIVAAWLLVAQSAFAASPIPAHIATAKGDVALTLETATTPETRNYGLMNRKTLKPNDGMVFLFPRESRLSFWMKDTLIPLDMLFIDKSGTIAHINPQATPLSTTPIDSSTPILTVIEIDGGRAAREGIAVGDKVTYRFPEGTHAQ